MAARGGSLWVLADEELVEVDRSSVSIGSTVDLADHISGADSRAMAVTEQAVFIALWDVPLDWHGVLKYDIGTGAVDLFDLSPSGLIHAIATQGDRVFVSFNNFQNEVAELDTGTGALGTPVQSPWGKANELAAD
jgi:hypothetical protein